MLRPWMQTPTCLKFRSLLGLLSPTSPCRVYNDPAWSYISLQKFLFLLLNQLASHFMNKSIKKDWEKRLLWQAEFLYLSLRHHGHNICQFYPCQIRPWLINSCPTVGVLMAQWLTCCSYYLPFSLIIPRQQPVVISSVFVTALLGQSVLSNVTWENQAFIHSMGVWKEFY